MRVRVWALVLAVVAFVLSWLVLFRSESNEVVRLREAEEVADELRAPTRASDREEAPVAEPTLTAVDDVLELALHLSTAEGQPVPGVVVWLVPDRVLTRVPLGVGGAQALATYVQQAQLRHAESDDEGVARFSGVEIGTRWRWVSFRCRPTEVWPQRDTIARLWSEELAGVSGPLVARRDSGATRWVLEESCSVVGELEPCAQAVVRLLRRGKPSDPEQADWTQERYLELKGKRSDFRFDGLEPGEKLINVRFQQADGRVGFAALIFEVAPGTTHDVGLLAPRTGLTLNMVFVFRDDSGRLLSLRDLAADGEVPRFSAAITTESRGDIVEDVFENFRFGPDGRASLVGLSRGRLTVFYFQIEPAFAPYQIDLPKKVEVDLQNDETIEIQVTVRRPLDVRVFLSIDGGKGQRPDRSGVFCLPADGGPVGRLTFFETRPDGFLFVGRLPVGSWHLRGCLLKGEVGYVVDHTVDVHQGRVGEIRVPASEPSWLAGERSPGEWIAYATPEEAAQNVWPFMAKADEDGHFRVPVPAHEQLLELGKKKTVLSGAPGRTVFVD